MTSLFYAVSVLIFASCLLLAFAYIFEKKFIKRPRRQRITAVRDGSSTLTKYDRAAIAFITLIYSLVAFFNLGNTSAPQSGLRIDGESVQIDLGKSIEISDAAFYLGEDELSESNVLELDFLDENKKSVHNAKISSGSVFCWNYTDELNISARYVNIACENTVYINEFAFFDNYGQITVPVSAPNSLFDEQNEVPKEQSFKNSTYFDEIYHARTAYEFLNGSDVYEWTHPPLGKIFISAGIRLFGMTPFGWRFAGTVFGILMLPAIYLLMKRMLKNTCFSVCGTLAFAFDFMHFTQSRIATIDVFVTFFILLMYLFMYKYYTTDFSVTPLKKTFLPLGACGISFGLACACKWTGIYAGAGTAVIFFMKIFELRSENNPTFAKDTLKTLLFCVLFFIVIPLTIYAASYIPYLKCTGEGFYGIIQNQIDMLTYHGKTVVDTEHPYSSPWYLWPIIFRPIWYFSGSVGNKTSDISAMGNPAVWWTGIVSFFICLKNIKSDKNARFLSVAYLAQLLPWIFVTRTTFIYHYFPCVPFIAVMIVFVIHNAARKNAAARKYLYIYTAYAIILFALFYPAISGYPVQGEYIENALRWFPSWQLTK